MGAYHGADIVYHYILYACALTYQIRQILRVLEAVAVADEDSLVSAWQHSGFHAVRQCLQRSLPSPRLSDGYQMALIVHMHNRLYAEHGAYRGGGGGNAPAPLEVIQIVNGEPMAHMQLFVFNEVPHLLYGRALFLFLRGIVCYHALAEGRGERLTPVTPMPRLPVVICKPDFPISTPELFRRVDARTSRCRPDTEGICAALADGDMPKLARRMYNVFEDVLTRREGEIAVIKSRLLDGGALGAVVSGTGSAVFGLFADADSAAYAKRRLARDYAECFLTETIDRLEV